MDTPEISCLICLEQLSELEAVVSKLKRGRSKSTNKEKRSDYALLTFLLHYLELPQSANPIVVIDRKQEREMVLLCQKCKELFAKVAELLFEVRDADGVDDDFDWEVFEMKVDNCLECVVKRSQQVQSSTGGRKKKKTGRKKGSQAPDGHPVATLEACRRKILEKCK